MLKSIKKPARRRNNAKIPGRYLRPKFESLEARQLLAVSPIVLENQLPGNPASEWDIVGAGDASIQGYATDISVDQGQTVSFKVDNPSLAFYRIDVYRIGYYGGHGARKVATIPSSQTLRQDQPNPLTDSATGLIDAGNWTESATWNVPTAATSGVYIAKLVREDTGGSSHIIFVVRDDDGGSDMLFQTSDSTWQAYNRWGGNSFYVGPFSGRAYALSYNRPFDTRATTPKDWFFSSEYAMVRWLEKNGYDVSYSTNVDSDRRGNEILEHDVFLSVAHDEYWSAAQRANVEAARDAGVHLAFFSGNEVYWKARWANSLGPSNTPYRTLISYKETWDNAKIDPLPNTWTGTWRDDRFSPPADGGKPENALTGQIFTVNRGPGGDTGTPITVGADFKNLRFWRNTRVANLLTGQSTNIGDYVLGYEWDEDLDNGFRPAGLIPMSSTTQNVPQKIDQYGGRTTSPGVATHSLTLYRASSGALVFGAGTINWSWGLDGTHDVITSTPDPAIQQATVNLFADMGVQPETLQSGLTYATMSTDVIAPESTVTSVSGGSTLLSGVPVTISGTASDQGGVVSTVEVSTDGGRTWHRANGKNSWTYSWTPATAGPTQILSRAADDSANLGISAASFSVTVQPSPTSSAGLVAAYRFNEGSGTVLTDHSGNNNHGTITGAVFASGFAGQALSFDGVNDMVTIADSNSLDLTSGMTLEAWVRPADAAGYTTVMLKESTANGFSYGLYSSDDTGQPPAGYARVGTTDASVRSTSPLPLNTWSHLTLTYDAAFLTLYVNGSLVRRVAQTGNITTSGQPLRIGGNNSYVDEFFQGLIDEVRIYNRALSPAEILYNMSTPVTGTTDNVAPSATVTSPASGSTVSNNITVDVSASDNVAVASVTLSLNGIPLSVDTTAPYQTVLDTRKLLNGSHTLTGQVIDMVGNAANIPPRIFTVVNMVDTTPPTVKWLNPDAGQTGSGTIVLSAFGTDNVALAGIRFQVDGNAIGTEDTTAPYQVTWNSASVSNGVHQLTAISRDISGNETSSQVSITVDNTVPVVVSVTPAGGSSQIGVSTHVVATLSESIKVNAAKFELRNPANQLVPATLQWDANLLQLHLIPNQTLSPSTTYTATLSGVRDEAGNVAATQSWSFTTVTSIIGSSLWSDTVTPATASINDPNAVELGVRFHSSVDGYITGLRFYKGPANTGTHVGKLWTNSGALLGSVTFTSETATGWQLANFTNPIPITANTDYVASYFAPNGGYAHNGAYFQSNYQNGSLTAVASGTTGNGLYLYSSTGGFPTQSFNASNYWVDVKFSTSVSDETAPTIVSQSPAASATSVPLSTAPQVTFSEAIQSSTIQFELRSNGNLVPATLTYDTNSLTATLTPSAQLATQTTYTATVSGARDLAGNTMQSVNWSFTTVSAAVSNLTLWSPSTVPATASSNDTSAVELGVKFRTSVSGYITGVRFYKGSLNTGTHLGRIWSSTGTLLASATFTGETSSGWQQVNFGSPLAVTANTTYVASYYAPRGRYAHNAAYFASAGHTNGVLTALANGVAGGNGVYRYGNGGGFPNQSFNSANYWVDVVYSSSLSDQTPPSITARTPAVGGTNVATSSVVTATFSEPIQVGTINFSLASGSNIPATVTYNSATLTATLTPTSPLANNTTYTATLSGVTDTSGNVMSTQSWSFTTALTNGPSTIWDLQTTPAVASANDTDAVELGVKFQANTNGNITGLRFYKGSLNIGTHLGRIWTSGGTLLGTATFVNETSTGWQEVILSSPIAITANTTYVASYYAPNGGYAYNSAYFASGSFDNGPLSALGDGIEGGNGVYRYGTGGGFPSSSYESSNYWVDVLFVPSSGMSSIMSSGKSSAPPPTTALIETSTTTEPSLISLGITPNRAVSAIDTQVLDQAFADFEQPPVRRTRVRELSPITREQIDDELQSVDLALSLRDELLFGS